MKPNEFPLDKIAVKSRYHYVKDAIASLIREQCRDGSQLPSEAQLARMLGVSRNTVREALRILEREGMVFSRHGVGTFVINTGKASNLTVLNKVADFVREHGYAPGAKNIRRSRVPAPAAVAARLLCAPGTELVCVEGVRTANGKPVIYVRDYFVAPSVWEDAVESFRNETFFSCLMEKEGIAVSHSNCGVHAVVSDDELCGLLSLKRPTALLKLEQIHFSSKGEPIMYSDSWFVSDKFNFTVVRRGF